MRPNLVVSRLWYWILDKLARWSREGCRPDKTEKCMESTEGFAAEFLVEQRPWARRIRPHSVPSVLIAENQAPCSSFANRFSHKKLQQVLLSKKPTSSR
jgi:hypothetical protein